MRKPGLRENLALDPICIREFLWIQPASTSSFLWPLFTCCPCALKRGDGGVCAAVQHRSSHRHRTTITQTQCMYLLLASFSSLDSWYSDTEEADSGTSPSNALEHYIPDQKQNFQVAGGAS